MVLPHLFGRKLQIDRLLVKNKDRISLQNRLFFYRKKPHWLVFPPQDLSTLLQRILQALDLDNREVIKPGRFRSIGQLPQPKEIKDPKTSELHWVQDKEIPCLLHFTREGKSARILSFGHLSKRGGKPVEVDVWDSGDRDQMAPQNETEIGVYQVL